MARVDPLPRRPWRLFMRWEKLLFAHWEVEPSALRPLIPTGLELDLFEGRAFVAVVPFTMTGIRLRGLPEIPGTHAFHELNVRTYVRYKERPGVWFFSLDANNRLAVSTARAWFHLRYMDCRLSMDQEGDSLHYRAARTERELAYQQYPTAGGPPVELIVRYRAQDPIEPEPLDRFLSERYCLYSCDQRGNLFRGEIDHVPWPLHTAEAEFEVNTMTNGLGFPLEGSPRLLYSPSIEVIGWGPDRLTT